MDKICDSTGIRDPGIDSMSAQLVAKFLPLHKCGTGMSDLIICTSTRGDGWSVSQVNKGHHKNDFPTRVLRRASSLVESSCLLCDAQRQAAVCGLCNGGPTGGGPSEGEEAKPDEASEPGSDEKNVLCTRMNCEASMAKHNVRVYSRLSRIPGGALGLLELAHMLDEHVEEELGVERAGARLGVELHAAVGQPVVHKALVRAVVLVVEQRLPLGLRRQRLHVEREPVVLTRDEAARAGARQRARLVVAAVAVPVIKRVIPSMYYEYKV